MPNQTYAIELKF